MTDKYKEALQAVLQAKKDKGQRTEGSKRDIYQSSGSKRAGIKRYKKGGLFDK